MTDYRPERPLPCDVMVPPATVIRKGCDVSVLLTALRVRVDWPPEECRFTDPIKKFEIKTPEDRCDVMVCANDYSYQGAIVGLAVKLSGAIRYIVEDDRGRLFIHNAAQLGQEEGWLP